MKRNTILSALLLLAVSCVQEGHFSTPSAPETEPTVPVILSFADPVTLQADTRAGFGTEMGVEPAITSIHVAVFGSSGYLKDYVSAVPCDSQGNVPGEYADKNYDDTDETTVANTTYHFMVRLPVNLERSPRTLHIIANGPSSLPFNAYEPDVMRSMTVGDGVGAYWQRIYLQDGIWASEDDYADEGYTLHSPLNELKDIKLIRNFAQVVVSESARNFKLVSYMLCNMPESGSVAAYSDEDEHWMNGEELMPDPVPLNFMSDGFINYGENGAKRYAGFPLEPVLNTFIPSSEAEYEESGMAVDTFMDAGDQQNEPDPYKSIGYPIYVYERAVTHDTPPFILMKGKWVDNDTQDEDLDEKFGDADYTYYRLDIARDEFQFFPLYRNYRYEVRITGVEVSGYDTPGEAAKHNSGDNFSISLETELLSDVANDKLHLFVQEPFIDLTYDSNIHEFWYRLLVRNGSNQSVDNGEVKISLVPGGDALAEIGANEIPGATAGTYWYREDGDRDAPDDQDNLVQERFVKYKLNNPASSGASKLSSTLRLFAEVKENEGTANEKIYRLSREVTIRVYNPETEDLRLVPDWIPNDKGQKTRLEIPLPLDLERSMFPLNITIWDDDKALNPTKDEQMPVSVSAPSYGFDYILNWSNYQQLCQEAEYAGADHALLTCDLQTIKAISNRGTAAEPDYSTTVHAECDYFKGTAVLHADSDTYLKPSWKTVKLSDGSPVVSVKSGSAWSLTITLEDGSAAAGASLSKSYNSQGSEEDVTVTLPPVGNHNVLYRLTLANADQLTRTAYILQETSSITVSLLPDYTGTSPKTVPSGTVGSSETYSKIVTVESGVPYYLQISEDGTTWVDASSRLETDDPVKLRVPGNPGTSSRTLYIRARSAEVDGNGDPVLTSNTVQVNQDGATAHLRAPATIRNYESDAGVMVRSSMPVVLKAYDANDLNNLVELIVPVYDENGNRVQVESVDASTPLSLSANSNGKDYKLRLGTNSSNADRVFQLKLFDLNNNSLVDRTVIQTASFSLSPAETEIACDATSAELTFKTEVDGTFAVSGGDNTYGTVTSGVSITPNQAGFDPSHPEILQHALTLTVPANNTIEPRTYTVTATNSTYTWKEIENNAIVSTTGRSRSVTVTQAAGTAELTVAEPDMDTSDNDVDIRMNDTGVDVNVKSSFRTMVRVYCGNTLLTPSGSETEFVSNTTTGTTHSVPVPANDTGSDRTLTLRLCNADGVEFPTLDRTVTQSGTPVFTLTPSTSNIGRDGGTVTLTFTTEVDGTFAVSGGNTYGTVTSGMSVSPASVTTSSYGTHALTLTVPANNTVEDRTYTVTATNSTYNCTATATVVQAAGDAHLTVVDTEILMCQPTAQVRVDASFDTVLKVYDHTADPNHTGTPLYTSSTRTANTTATVETLSNLVNTGSARTLDVDLCNTDGKVVGTGTITQQPGIRLVAAQTSVKGDGTPVTLTVISDVPWQLTSTNGGTFGPAGNTVATCTGPATDYAGQQVRWDLPANYATGTRTLTATASGTGSNSSLTDQASVTQSGSTGHVDNRTTAYIYYYNNYNGLGTQSYTYSNSYTSGGRTYRYTITGELSDITDRISVGTDRVEVSKESTFTLSASKNCRITQAKLIYYSTYGPDSITSSVGTVTSEIYYRDRWDGDVSNGNDVEFTFHKSGTDAIALNYYTVTVTVYSWD